MDKIMYHGQNKLKYGYKKLKGSERETAGNAERDERTGERGQMERRKVR